MDEDSCDWDEAGASRLQSLLRELLETALA